MSYEKYTYKMHGVLQHFDQVSIYSKKQIQSCLLDTYV